jgi:hypothetical protein
MFFSNSFTVNGGEHVNNEHGFVLHEQDGNTNSKTDSVNYEFDLAKRTEGIDQRDACLFHDTTDKKKSTYCCNHDIICTALFDTESFFTEEVCNTYCNEVTDAVDVNGMPTVVNNLSCGDCPADSDCDGNGGGGRRADVPNVNASAGVNSSMHDNGSEDDGSELHEGDGEGDASSDSGMLNLLMMGVSVL